MECIFLKKNIKKFKLWVNKSWKLKKRLKIIATNANQKIYNTHVDIALDVNSENVDFKWFKLNIIKLHREIFCSKSV